MAFALRTGASFTASIFLGFLAPPLSIGADWKREAIFPDLAARIARPRKIVR